jgi:outer membrane protein assembly factor BamB
MPPQPTLAVAPATLEAPSSDSRVAWTFAAGGAIYAGATVSDGAVYFGSDDGYLYSVDLASHDLRWKFRTAGFVRSVPAIAGGIAYVASDDGNVYAVNTKDGSQAWKAAIGNAANPRVVPDPASPTWDFHQSSPVVADGTVYVGSADKHVYALDAATGKVEWQFQAGGIVRDTAAVSDGTVYIGSWMDGMPYYSTLYALDGKSGKQKWSFAGAGDHPTPVLANGMVYTGGRQAAFYEIEAATGTARWMQSFQTSWVESTAAYADGNLYVGSSGLDLVQSFDATTGHVRWQFTPKGLFPWSSPAVADGVVYIGTASNGGPSKEAGLSAIDARTGLGLWWLAVGASTLDTSGAQLTGIAAGPVVAGGVLYVGGLDGKLYAVKVG